MRHETTLHRQIDTSIKMLGRELPHMTEGRARRRALADYHTTELECRRDDASDWAVTEKARQYLAPRPFPPSLNTAMLDTANCQNEPAACPGMAENSRGMACHATTDGSPAPGLEHANCQNEPTPAETRPAPEPEPEARVGAWHAMPVQSHAMPLQNDAAPVQKPPVSPCPIVNLDDLGLQPGHPAFGLLFASQLRL